MTLAEFIQQVYTVAAASPIFRGDQRVFGADNTGGWHVHPFDEPARHDSLPDEMSFADFIAAIERHRRS